MPDQDSQAGGCQPGAESPPPERRPVQPPGQENKERGPLWVKAPPRGVELRGFLRIMLGG